MDVQGDVLSDVLMTPHGARAPRTGGKTPALCGAEAGPLLEVRGLYLRDLFNLGKNLTFSYF